MDAHRASQRAVIANVLEYMSKSGGYNRIERFIAKELSSLVRHHLYDDIPLASLIYTKDEWDVFEKALILFTESSGSDYRERL